MNKLIVVLIFLSCTVNAQNKFDINQYANFEKYREANVKLDLPSDTETRVVFIGNSITEAWRYKDPEFFDKNDYTRFFSVFTNCGAYYTWN